MGGSGSVIADLLGSDQGALSPRFFSWLLTHTLKVGTYLSHCLKLSVFRMRLASHPLPTTK